MAIRSYGPGKFDTKLDSYLYELSLDGCDDELGDAQELGWYGTLLFGPTTVSEVQQVASEHHDALNVAEIEALKDSFGVLLREGSEGFVSVMFFRNKRDMDSAWQDVMEEYEDWLGPDE
jgi:hypothetical protein